MSDFARVVRNRREQWGLSQQQLADLAGVSQTTIDKIERGLTKKSKYSFDIASKLGLSPTVVQNLLSPSAHSLGDIDLATSKLSAASGRSLPSSNPYLSERDTIPLYYAQNFLSDSEGEWLVTDADGNEVSQEPIVLSFASFDRLTPPDFLRGVKGAFGFWMPNNSMAPCISVTDRVLVHPLLPCVSGSFCIFTLPPREEQTILVAGLLKEETDELWRFWQPRLGRNVSIPKARWSANRVVATYYRF